jgi:hypothetical protein
MKIIQHTSNLARRAIQSRTSRLTAIGMTLALLSTQTLAQEFQLPMSGFFCKVALAMQSQWAPGILLICIIVEAFLFLVVKKGILQTMMVIVLAGTLALSGGKFLGMITPGASCSAASGLGF